MEIKLLQKGRPYQWTRAHEHKYIYIIIYALHALFVVHPSYPNYFHFLPVFRIQCVWQTTTKFYRFLTKETSPFMAGACWALTLERSCRYHILGMVRGLLGRGPGYTVFTPSRKPKKPKNPKNQKNQKHQRFGTNNGQGGGCHGCQNFAFFYFFFIFWFFGFLSAFLSNRKPEKDKRIRRWEEIDMRNWYVVEIYEEKGPTGKYQKLGAHNTTFYINISFIYFKIIIISRINQIYSFLIISFEIQ